MKSTCDGQAHSVFEDSRDSWYVLQEKRAKEARCKISLSRQGGTVLHGFIGHAKIFGALS